MKNKTLSFIVAILGLILVWHLCSLALDKPFLPTPYAACVALVQSTAEGTILSDFGISTMRIVVSLLISLLIGVPLGLLIGTNKTINRFLSPLVYVLYPLPKVVFLPIIVVLLGDRKSTRLNSSHAT